MENKKMNKWLLRLIVIVVGSMGAYNMLGVNPVMADLKVMFADRSLTSVQMLQTITNFGFLAVSFVIGILCTKINRKRLILIVIGLISICGLIPAVVPGYNTILITRLCIGFGLGSTFPVLGSIMRVFTSDPKEIANLVGLQYVGYGTSAIFMNMGAGALANIKFEYFFFVYFYAVAVFLFAAFILPSIPPAQSKEKAKEKGAGKALLPPMSVVFLAFFILMWSIFIGSFYGYQAINYRSTFGLNNAQIGLYSSFSYYFTIILGFLTGIINTKFKRYVIIFPFSIVVICYIFIVSIPTNLAIFVLGCCGVMIAGSLLIPAAMYNANISAKPEGVGIAISTITIAQGVGGLLAPIIANALIKATYGALLPLNAYKLQLCVFAITFIAAIFYSLHYTKKDKANSLLSEN